MSQETQDKEEPKRESNESNSSASSPCYDVTLRDLVAIKCLDFFKDEIKDNVKGNSYTYIADYIRKCYKFSDEFIEAKNMWKS